MHHLLRQLLLPHRRTLKVLALYYAAQTAAGTVMGVIRVFSLEEPWRADEMNILQTGSLDRSRT